MKRFTEEELARANSVDLLAYVRSRGYAVKRMGRQHCLAEHDSLVIEGNKWYWFSQRTGGKTIDFLVKYEKIPFVEAVHTLLGDAVQKMTGPMKRAERSAANADKPRKLMLLPVAERNDEAIAYLQGRGIPMELIQRCIDEIRLYQADTYWRRKEDGSYEELPGKQVVFVGYDADYTPRYACSRSLQGSGKHEAYGSDKSYAFALPAPEPECKVIWVFESAIDALSHAALCKQGGNPWPAHRLSLGGLSPLALERYLAEHPAIRYVNLGLDNDEQGRRAAQAITASLAGRYIAFHHPPRHGKDYNDELVFQLRTRSREAER